ncbi:MAG: hypothetical protein ACKVXR_04830 [Planctomycetota bacterium]
MRVGGIIALAGALGMVAIAIVLGFLAMQMQDQKDQQTLLQNLANELNGQSEHNASVIEGLLVVAGLLVLGALAVGAVGAACLMASFMGTRAAAQPGLVASPLVADSSLGPPGR